MHVDLWSNRAEEDEHLIQQQARLLSKKFLYILAISVSRTDTTVRIKSVPVVSTKYG